MDKVTIFKQKIVEAKLIHRPNRFVVHIEINGTTSGASLPNPGKLGELFIPGATLLVHAMEKEGVKYPWRVSGVISPQGMPIMLDTHVNNRVAEWLIENKRIPSLAEWSIKRREVTVGHSRFDLLLSNGDKEKYCEVKSCTLFHNELGMFPDAETARGKRHVEELGELSDKGIDTTILIVVQSSEIAHFLPDFHTDPAFSKTLYQNREKVQIIPIGLGWNDDLTISGNCKELTIPWEIYEKHQEDSGYYLFLTEIKETKKITIGALGEKEFKPGFYCYVGSAKKGLTKRIERHRRRRKNHHWHLDYFREESTVVASWPIRLNGDFECSIADAIKKIADGAIDKFGSSDCSCDSHLFYFQENPKLNLSFQEILLHFRMSPDLLKI